MSIKINSMWCPSSRGSTAARTHAGKSKVHRRVTLEDGKHFHGETVEKACELAERLG